MDVHIFILLVVEQVYPVEFPCVPLLTSVTLSQVWSDNFRSFDHSLNAWQNIDVSIVCLFLFRHCTELCICDRMSKQMQAFSVIQLLCLIWQHKKGTIFSWLFSVLFTAQTFIRYTCFAWNNVVYCIRLILTSSLCHIYIPWHQLLSSFGLCPSVYQITHHSYFDSNLLCSTLILGSVTGIVWVNRHVTWRLFTSSHLCTCSILMSQDVFMCLYTFYPHVSRCVHVSVPYSCCPLLFVAFEPVNFRLRLSF